MVSQPCRFFFLLVLIMEKKSSFFRFDVVKLRLFSEITMVFVEKMWF